MAPKGIGWVSSRVRCWDAEAFTWISLWLKPSSPRTKTPQCEGTASCCWWSSASTEKCPPPLCLANPPWYDSTLVRIPSILCLVLCFPSLSWGKPSSLSSSPPPCPQQHHSPGARLLLHPADPPGADSQKAQLFLQKVWQFGPMAGVSLITSNGIFCR